MDAKPETSITDPEPPSVNQQQLARPKTPREFSVPRRYDLATLMAVTMAYACLFGALRAWGAPPEFVIWVAGFLTTVGAAQAILFGGKSPRGASVLAGMVYMVATFVVLMVIEGFTEFCFLLAAVLYGTMLGYFGGVIVAGVFLVAHYLRCLWPSNKVPIRNSESETNSKPEN